MGIPRLAILIISLEIFQTWNILLHAHPKVVYYNCVEDSTVLVHPLRRSHAPTGHMNWQTYGQTYRLADRQMDRQTDGHRHMDWQIFKFLFRVRLLFFSSPPQQPMTSEGSLVWRGPWLGVEPWTSRTRSQHSTTRLSRRRCSNNEESEESIHKETKRKISKQVYLKIKPLTVDHYRQVWIYQFPVSVITSNHTGVC